LAICTSAINASLTAAESGKIPATSYISRRFSSDFDMVTSSANSRSLPTGMPMAMRVTFTPSGFSSARDTPPWPRLPPSDWWRDHLLHFAALHPLQQTLDAQLLRPDAAQRRDGAVQHMIQALELPRGLDGQNIVRLLHHADDGMIAMRIAAVIAQIAVADVVADGANSELVLHVEQRLASRSASSRDVRRT
jgi:hypothetical protein